MQKKKKVELNDLRKSGWVVKVDKVGKRKRKRILQTTFLDIKEDK